LKNRFEDDCRPSLKASDPTAGRDGWRGRIRTFEADHPMTGAPLAVDRCGTDGSWDAGALKVVHAQSTD
jgi:hypothetical protein